MKIAVLLFHFPVLSETFILNQVTGLIDRGHDVRIFCRTPGNDQIEHGDVKKYNLKARTIYFGSERDRAPNNKLLRVAKAVTVLLRHLNKNPVPLLRSLNFLRFGKKALSFRLFYLVLPFLENNIHEYDVVLCHFFPNGDLAAMLKGFGAVRGKVVTITHGEAGYTGKRKQVTLRYFKHNDYETLLRLGDLFLPMSEYEKQSLIDLGCDPEKIVVHKMGVDLKKFSFRSPQMAENGSIRLLSVGRLVEKKGFEYAIQAVGAVSENHPDIEYKIAGDGPLQKDLQELIDRLRIDDKVKLLGALPQEKIVDLIGIAHLFLAPSAHSSDGDQEGIPVVLMEAMSRGLPVISTYHAGIPELIKDGISGLLVPERDTKVLTEKLEYLIEHPELWPGMAAAAKEHIHTHHSIDALSDTLAQLFERLLDGAHP